MASRIFVKNLPPNLKEDDFKKHFSSLAPVTDAKFIPKRRIGYVGYKTPETALQAIKYFNKSFIRMSKINVELARPADEVQPRKKARIQDESDLPQNNQTVEKTVVKDDPKLQEFLVAMAPSSKSKTWGNGDLPAQEPEIVSVLPAEEEAVSEDEYQTISKKRKRSSEPEEAPKAAISQPPPEGSEGVTAVDASEKVIDDTTNHLDEAIGETTQASAPPASDTDWLRSKTSRLLGLVDDDELDEQAEDSRAIPTKSIPKPEPDFEDFEDEPIDTVKQGQGDDDAAMDETTSPPEPLENSETGRLFLRNLSYGTSESDLEKIFSKYGLIEEVHISKDTRSGVSKGLGYIQFAKPDEALAAKDALDSKPFQGRLLHIMLAKAKKANGLDEYEISKLPLKKQKEIRRKQEASTATFKWNSLYMNQDAILSSVASRLGVSKTDVLDPTSSDAAVKQAHAETNVIKETKDYFSSHGVNLDSFKGKEYSDQAILVKNFPYGTSAEELKKMFEVYGKVTRLLMPPSATIAVIEMEQATQSRSAFSAMAYRKFKDSVLFLEKAPKAVFESATATVLPENDGPKLSTSDILAEDNADAAPMMKCTLFVRNLNFSTTSLDLKDLFMPLNGFLSATVKTKTDPKKPGQTLSMGFGFVEFRSKEDAQSAMSAMNGHKLAGHELLIKESNKAIDAGEERRKEDAAKKLAGQRTKIVLRNLPFEATKKDVRALVAPYGQLRTVRVPKKFDSTSRGFAFAEFVTTREAENAIKSLNGVHLLGRRLNLEYAAGDTMDAEEEIEKMSKKVGKQADKVAIQNLTSGGRKKFSVRQGEDAEMD